MSLNVFAAKPFRLIRPLERRITAKRFLQKLLMVCNSKKKNLTLLFIIIGIAVWMLFAYRTGQGPQQVTFSQAKSHLKTVRNSSQAEKNATVERPVKPYPKPFLYLIQTEQCLPQNLSLQIGNEKACNCDVIVLSFQTECREDKPSHISYIIDIKSTWASGRNKLFFTARVKKPGYRYYIFMDDDVYLQFNAFTPQNMKKMTPYRAYEKWLLDNEPAVGVCDYFGAERNKATFIWQRRQRNCGITDNYKKSTTLPVVFFDALLNAIHYKSLEHLLPFPTQYDNNSWWSSQVYVICSAELKFRGQVLLFVPVSVFNLKHRNYPRKLHNFNQRANEFVKEIQNKAPAVYRSRPLFKELRYGKLEQYALKSITYCMEPTHRHEIVPYAHFEREGLEL